jgi:hypothetical protein
MPRLAAEGLPERRQGLLGTLLFAADAMQSSGGEEIRMVANWQFSQWC